MFIRKLLVAAIALIPIISHAQNYSDYELSTLKFVASGQSSYTQGADLATAQNELAIRYFNGTGGAVKNLQSAAYWFEKSANNGNKYAQYNLAWRYYQGEGVSKNYSKALYWFEKAGKQNYHKASLKAGKMLFYGEGTHISKTLHLEIYPKANITTHCALRLATVLKKMQLKQFCGQPGQ